MKLRQQRSQPLANKPSILYAHTGSSMNPTLCRRDLLEIEPYVNRMIQVGDVIVFTPPDDVLTVVHRIVELSPTGICTRGDSNEGVDRYLVQPKDIAGRVIAAWRGKRRRKIPGGRVAFYQVNITRRWQMIDQLICACLYPLYAMIARIGIINRLLSTGLQPRVVVFMTGDSRQLRLILGSRLIGHYEDDRNRWVIHRPFRLFVAERQLPNPLDFNQHSA